MAKTFEELNKTIFENTLNTCEYVSGYENIQSIVTIRCIKHNHTFTTAYENLRRKSRAHHVCPYCQQEDIDDRFKDNRVETECAYCGKKIFVVLSKSDRSKSGLHFCCREHKDLAQRIDGGEKFDTMRPNHYGTGLSNYRDNAFNTYDHCCAICGWNEDEDILEVHHIDENHSNNDIANLMILCPICHRKITSKKYRLIKNNALEKI